MMDATLLTGEVLAVLRRLPDRSVQTVVTSPPYWGLRDYGTANWKGGRKDCTHQPKGSSRFQTSGQFRTGTVCAQQDMGTKAFKDKCPRCGAIRRDQQLGLEKTPALYVERLVAVFREVRRCLRPDGVVFVNLGDSYSSKEYGRIRAYEEQAFFQLPLEIRCQVFAMWGLSLSPSLPRNVREMLFKNVEGEEPRQGKSPRQKALREQQTGISFEDRKTDQGASNGDDAAARRQMRVLRRNGANVSLSRSHQGRRPTRVQEKRRIQRSVEAGDQGRPEPEEISRTMLELQRRAWSLWKVHSLDLDLSNLPREARRFFDVTLKPKDLVGIPWRVAFALQADGWYLRSEIIWHKKNPMPESVTDRPTKSHEQIFLLTKSARYFYDAEAIREPAAEDTHARYARGRGENPKYADGGPGHQTIARTFDHMRAAGVNPKAALNAPGSKQNASFSAAVKDVLPFRNKRTVWSIASHPYKGAHFATFPPKLIEPCILAGSRAGDVVMDIFSGAATTGVVAHEHGRHYIGIDLNPVYHRLARRRLAKPNAA